MWNKLLKGIKGIKGEVDLTILFFGLFIAIAITAMLPTMAAVTNNINLQDAIRVMNAQGYWCTATEQVYPYNFYPAGDNTLENGKSGAAWSNTQSYLYNGSPLTRSADYVFAANDSCAAAKAQADYICDGTNDNVEIHAKQWELGTAAYTANYTATVLLLPGIYWMGNEADHNISKHPRVSLIGYGAVLKAEPNLNDNTHTIMEVNGSVCDGDHSGTIIAGFEFDGNESNNRAHTAGVPYQQGLMILDKGPGGFDPIYLPKNLVVKDIYSHDTIRTPLYVSGNNNTVTNYHLKNSYEDHLIYFKLASYCVAENGLLEGYSGHDHIIFGTSAGSVSIHNTMLNTVYQNPGVHPLGEPVRHLVDFRADSGSYNRLVNFTANCSDMGISMNQEYTNIENFNWLVPNTDTTLVNITRPHCTINDFNAVIIISNATQAYMLGLDGTGALGRDFSYTKINNYSVVVSDNDTNYDAIELEDKITSSTHVSITNSSFLNSNAKPISHTVASPATTYLDLTGTYFSGISPDKTHYCIFDAVDSYTASTELDLSGGVQTVPLYVSEGDGKLVSIVSRVTFLYTEGTAADVGVGVWVGKTTNTDYYLYEEATPNASQWEVEEFVNEDFIRNRIQSGLVLTATTTGNSTGAGKVLVTIEIARMQVAN